MGNDVFANGREISCKAADGKSIAAFPDTCFTPPENPATPPGVPLPYPNTGFATDTTGGTTTVKITGKEVMLKNKSYFKKSTGDEAGCAAKKGVITSVNRGKVYFTAWSMDVKFEGENVVRNLDLTTHNHASQPGQTPPWTYLDTMAVAPSDHPCKTEIDKAQDACKTSTVTESGRQNCSPDCKAAMGCIFPPKKLAKSRCCPPDNTGDHLIEDHWIRQSGSGSLMPDFSHLSSQQYGAYHGAPTMCVNKEAGGRFKGKHGIAHGTRGVMEDTFVKPGRKFTYAAGKAMARESVYDAYGDSGCSKDCIDSQLDAFYGKDPKGMNRELRKPSREQPLTEKQREDAIARVFG